MWRFRPRRGRERTGREGTGEIGGDQRIEGFRSFNRIGNGRKSRERKNK